jgi:hypothetical protein
VVGGAGTTVLGGAVDLAEAADTNGLAHVDVAGTGGGADVEPVKESNVNWLFCCGWTLCGRTSQHPGEEARWRQRS